MFCLNDVVRVPIEEYAGNLVKIIEQCRGAGAEVLLCTCNGVHETGGRPISRIREYLAALKRVGQEQQVPVADCFEEQMEVKARDAWEFALLMSDEIHPNMAGHKLDAERIAQAITGKKVSLANVGPVAPSLRRTARLLKEDKPVTILAMPPFDGLLGPAFAEVAPQAQVRIVPWPTAGKTLADMEAVSKTVRNMKPDLVLLAVPASAAAPSLEEYRRSYTWIMNWSLSFGYQEWDCIAVPASTVQPELSADDAQRDALARKLILAQDIGTLERKPGDAAPLPELLTRWLRAEIQP
jgi:hypothetical protein